MRAWRVVLLTLSFLLLGGCLVTFHEPLPSNQAAPKALLGKWSSKDAWEEPLKLVISRSGGDAYKAVATAKGKALKNTCSPCHATATAGTCRPACPSAWVAIS